MLDKPTNPRIIIIVGRTSLPAKYTERLAYSAAERRSIMTHKNYEKQFIGCSDIAALTLTGMRPADEPGDGTGLKTFALHFGGDGSYDAYVVDDAAEIGAHYALKATCAHWLRVYDDDELVREFEADIIRVYRAGDYGCVIQLCKAAAA